MRGLPLPQPRSMKVNAEDVDGEAVEGSILMADYVGRLVAGEEVPASA